MAKRIGDEEWFEKFGHIEHESDGEGDYYDEMMGELEDRDEEMRGSLMSSAWSRGRRRKETAEEVVYDMLEIKESVHNLLKIHGMPKGTSVGLAMIGGRGHGLSGFTDLDKFTGPFLRLDTGIYRNCDSTEVLDVYCGVGLHEAEHLNSTRLMFKRLKNGTLVPNSLRALWEGLFEDERIENLVRKKSPGYAAYLQAAKRALFEKKEFGKCLDNWEKAADLDRVLMLIFAVIRCPHLLKPEHKEWVALNGLCIFKELRELFPLIPESEHDIASLGEQLQGFWDLITDDYKKLAGMDAGDLARELAEAGGKRLKSLSGVSAPGCTDKDSKKPEGKAESGASMPGTSGEKSEGGEEGEEGGLPGSAPSDDDGTEAAGKEISTDGESKGKAKDEVTKKDIMEMYKRVLKHKKSLEEDEKLEKKMKELEEKLEKAAKELEAKSGTKDGEMDAEKMGKLEKAKEPKGLEKAERKVEEIEGELEKEREDRIGRRFSLIDFKEMMSRAETISDPLSVDEAREVAKATEERVEPGESWGSPDCAESATARRTIITHPTASNPEVRRLYQAAKKSVMDQVNRMKTVFRLRLGTRTYRETEKTEGRFHRRMIGRAMDSDRLFYRKYTKTDQGISLCLLLDESGSMGMASPSEMVGSGATTRYRESKATVALKVAVLIAEALRGVPGVELEVYSYASCGQSEKDNLVKYLYGKDNKTIESIGGYCHGAQNYDHMAIRTATDLFINNTTNSNRMMIVLSDGSPCGYDYGGVRAIKATKDAVDAAEKKGIHMVQVAIEDFDSSSMFKHVIKFLDLNDLINQMRRLVVRVVQRTTEGAK